MNLSFVTYQNSRLSYYKYGCGQNVLLCFCGYEQTGASFAFLVPLLKNNYTIIAINWFYFEDSFHPVNEQFTLIHYKELLQRIVLKENLNPQKISLMSFSIGIIPLLGCLKANIWQPNCLIICHAPGFAFFRLIKFGTTTLLGKYIFNLVISKHQNFNKIINSKIGKLFLNKSKLKLLNSYINYPQKLITIKHTWQTLRPLLVSKRKVNQLNFSVSYFISGKFDKITPAYLLKNILEKVGSNHIEVNTGHKLNTTEHVNVLRNILLNH